MGTGGERARPGTGKPSGLLVPILWAAVSLSIASIAGLIFQVSGESPFLTCAADAGQAGLAWIGSEVEPWVGVNPVDPRNVVGTWQQDRWSNGSARGLSVGVSMDGGETWRSAPLPGLTRCTGGIFRRATDPWLSFGPDGDLYHMTLATDGGRSAMLVQESIDGGFTWSDPLTLIDDVNPFFNDKNTITADPTDSRYIYATWDRLDFALRTGPAVLSRSVDGGESFEPVTVIHDPGPGGQTIGNQIVVLPDGTVLDFFTEILFFPRRSTTIALSRSFDKGETWDEPIAVSSILLGLPVRDPDRRTGVRAAQLLFDVAVDPADGALYVVWQDGRFASFLRDSIALSVSTDGGVTWSEPVRIDTTPDDLPDLNRQAFLPSVHVNEKGRAAVTFYDFRFNGLEPEALTDHWAITCNKNEDCADPENWAGEIRLTDRSFDILQAPFANGLFIGDYVGLASIGDEFLSLFSVTHDSDPSSVFARRFRFHTAARTRTRARAGAPDSQEPFSAGSSARWPVLAH